MRRSVVCPRRRSRRKPVDVVCREKRAIPFATQREQAPSPRGLWCRGSGSQRPTNTRCTAQARLNNQTMKWRNHEDVGPAQAVVALHHG